MTTSTQQAVASNGQPRFDSDGSAIRVFLVVDVSVYRELLADKLARDGRIEVAGATPGDIASMAVGMESPAVVLVDASSDDGPARIRRLAAAAPNARIVALGIPEDEEIVLELVEAGAVGFVTAEQPFEELVETIETAANGELKCSPHFAAALAERVAALRAGALDPNGEELTRRQREIAALIAEGLSNKQIAGRLSIARATVKNHVHNILAKLDVANRDELAMLFRTSLL